MSRFFANDRHLLLHLWHNLRQLSGALHVLDLDQDCRSNVDFRYDRLRRSCRCVSSR
jgi:hypothetical protein